MLFKLSENRSVPVCLAMSELVQCASNIGVIKRVGSDRDGEWLVLDGDV